jgi:hypothetical protein
MNRFTLGLVVPVTLLLAVGCNGDPTSDLRNGLDHIEAAPTQLFLQPGGSKTVEVSGVDEQGNQLDLAFETTNGSGITVKRDSTFHPIYVNDSVLTVPPTSTRWRFIVTGLSYAQTSFTVTSGGKNLVVPVQVVPLSQIQATFDKLTPALGDTVTLTAAPGTVFADTAALLIGGDATRPLTITSRAADGSSISFVPPPNVASPITITSVSSVGAPALTFSPSTDSILTTPVFDTMDVTLSTPTPTIAQTVTMSIPNPLITFDSVTTLAFEGEFPGPAAGPAAITVAADSSSLTFQAPPNANGLATVTSFVFPGGYPIALPTRTGIAVSPVLADTADVTASNLNPALLEPITITLPGTIRFGPAEPDTLTGWSGDSVFFGSNAAIVQSVDPGGANITVIPLPGSVGRPRLVGVFPTGFPQFSLSMQADDSVTVPELVPLEGTDDPATAPDITASIPFTLVDNGTWAATNCGTTSGGDTCQLYKLTFAAPTSLHFTLSGPGPADLGLYFLNGDLTDYSDFADANTFCDNEFNNAPPEDCTLNFPAGTFIMIVTSFGDLYTPPDPEPPFIQLNIQ